jgi:hypothetical protein
MNSSAASPIRFWSEGYERALSTLGRDRRGIARPLHHRQVPIPSDRAFDTSSIDQAWAATAAGGKAALPEAPARLCVTGASADLPSRFPVKDMAVACVGAAILAAAALWRQQGAPSVRSRR